MRLPPELLAVLTGKAPVSTPVNPITAFSPVEPKISSELLNSGATYDPSAGLMDPMMLDLLRRADSKESAALSMPAPKPVQPAFRTPDAVAGSLALLAALLGGKKGGEVGGAIAQGWLGGKMNKAQADTQYQQNEYAQNVRVAAHEAQGLRQRAELVQGVLNSDRQSKQAERAQYLGLAKAFADDMERMNSGNASMFIGRLNAIAKKAGIPELEINQEDEQELRTAMKAAEDRSIAFKMVPQLLTTLRSNGVPNSRMMSGLMLMNIANRYPEIVSTLGVDPAQVAKEMQELTPREKGEQTRAGKVEEDAKRAAELHGPKLERAKSEAYMSATKAKYLPDSLRLQNETKQKNLDRIDHSMSLGDARFNLSVYRDQRQAFTAIVNAGKELTEIRGLKSGLESEAKILKSKLDAIKENRTKPPAGMQKYDAVRELQAALDDNSLRRQALDTKGTSIGRNQAALKEFMRRLPSGQTRLPGGGIDKSSGAAALEGGFGPLEVNFTGGTPPHPNSSRQVPSRAPSGTYPTPDQAGVTVRGQAATKPKIDIAAERKKALEAMGKFKTPAQRKAIADAFYKTTGVKL